MLWGIDISRHQGGSFDLARAAREGIAYAIFKATEGNTWRDPQFERNLAAGRDAGLIVAAYHFVRSDSSAAAQLANIAGVVPKDVPLILDVESIKQNGKVVSAPSLTLVRELYGKVLAAGYRSPLIYLPRWYWQTWGAPALAGLPPLWSSRYLDYNGGTPAQIYQRIPGRFWLGYGGLSAPLLQFTSSATVAGHVPVDANAFDGTREQFAALLGSSSHSEKEIDMPAIPVSLPHSADWNYVALPFESKSNSAVVADGWFTIFAAWGEVEYEIATVGGGLNLVGLIGGTPTAGRLADRQRVAWQVPDGINGIGLRYRARNAKGDATNGRLGYSFPQKAK
ncbi:glycoside hydrolase family 25 protein [Amycolatopsis umgeniensis]|uniref:GH25 family lysozyme M1 (1,4-beta-N-acetylmuramidase) n=1 Tax=Amycolatopsis umgeniensis TaxID=336628 RepID=A0A841B3T5_9PSEU|nr:glycoside hydrolase family 25 protein [Amycolatopsis umgeniensis]MBB5853987.1 GH25 family lysozyme M1 (1,4-beta-N-acetylmuramidase) [Amycolatopsis umgeniensis]